MLSEVRGETEESPTILSYGKGFLYTFYKFEIASSKLSYISKVVFIPVLAI